MRAQAGEVRRVPRRVPRGCAVLAAAALAVPALAAAAAAQRLDYTGGVQSATGTYLFTERTTSVALLNGLSLSVGRLRLSAALPLLYQNSTAVTYIGGTPVPTGGPDAGAVREREPGRRVPMGPGRGPRGQGALAPLAPRAAGTPAMQEEPVTQVVAEPGDFEVDVGDPLLQAGVDLHRGVGVLRSLSVHALAKAPLADVESGVGTGEWDYGGGVALGLGSGAVFLLADASYWVVGDLPELPLRDALWYGVSLGRWLGSGRWSVLGSLAGATATIENVDAPLSAGLAVGYAPRATSGINAGLSFGLTESAPDVSASVGWRLSLGGRSP